MKLKPLPAGYALAGQYVIKSVLGSGGFGIAYRALDKTLDHIVAIKEYFPRSLVERGARQSVRPTVRASPGVRAKASGPLRVNQATAIMNMPANQEALVFEWGRQRFVKEAKMLARLRHPSIPQVFRVFEANGTSYMAYELLDGVALDAHVKAFGSVPSQARIDSLVEPLLGALATLHDAGIVHLDVSPRNVLVRQDGTPALLDFGSARAIRGRSRDGNEYVMVTEPYSPPELYRPGARVGPPADIYALAATMYEVLTRRLVPPSLERSERDACTPLSAVLSREQYRLEFLRGIDWALSVSADERPQSVADWELSLFPWKNLSDRKALNRRRGRKIFISYRRADTGRQAQGIYDFIARQFGARDVFFDVDSIPAGVDFRDHVRGSILESAVVLALIGSGWEETMRRRSKRPDSADFVRIELELAVENGIPIIPVLLDETPMPAPDALPPSVSGVSYMNATSVRLGANRNADLARLASAVRQFRD